MLNVKVTSTIDLNAVRETKERAMRQALGQTGLKILHDIVEVSPKPPIDTGMLRGSGFVIVDDRTIVGDAQANSGKDVVLVGVNTPYAARMHELPKYQSHKKPEANTDSGPKFVESKVTRFYRQYAELFAAKFRGFFE